MDGGTLVADVLRAQGTEWLFTVCGGHISPILVGAKAAGIRVVDTRHEATAVFAADAVARLTGRPGVAAVTAGPGLTNAVTAIKNAQLAQSPVVVLAGAAPTVLQGRGALQDIDQLALIRPHVTWAHSVRRVRDVVPCLERAFRLSRQGVPGPVVLEFPLDVLYDERLVRTWYGTSGARTPSGLALRGYLALRAGWIFAGGGRRSPRPPIEVVPTEPDRARIAAAARRLLKAQRPVVLVGSQALPAPEGAEPLAAALERLGAPVYLSGMARGVLGRDHRLHARHLRRQALREADLVLLAGVPVDFRLDYGRHLGRRCRLISANRSRSDLRRNRRPDIGILGDPNRALVEIARAMPADPDRWAPWLATVRARDEAREAEIADRATESADGVNPIRLCLQVAAALPPAAIVVGDGGDIVATASYILRTDGPLRWLDPGVFGTLGVGAGFALGAALVHPDKQVWVVFGDGAAGYSLAEFDTFVRHRVPVVAVVANDASWSQIARDQVEYLHDDVGTVLAHTRYDRVVAGFGALGIQVECADELAAALATARSAERAVLVNVRTGRGDFRKGSLSM